MIEFTEFSKISRYSREVIVTEKIDGTNAQICISEDGEILAGSCTRWIYPGSDNFGFAAWVEAHKEKLRSLGPGRHFGEWWGSGIQRGYGLKNGERRFSMFNVSRWCLHGKPPQQVQTADPRIVKMQDILPPCVGLVPILWRGNMDKLDVPMCMSLLKCGGSKAMPGFMNPEGIVIFHTASGYLFKKTFEKDDTGKGQQ